MFKEGIGKACDNSMKKSQLLRNDPMRYLLLSVMAGFYVGVAIFLIYSIGAPLHFSGSAVTKLIMGLTFSISLVLVVFAGSELFTGNVMYMTIGVYNKRVTVSDALRVGGISWAGNLLGAIFFSVIIKLTGLLSGQTADFIVLTSEIKTALPIYQLVMRGVLCNFLVCIALWMGMRVSEDITKTVFIFLCLFAFITSGYEHSVANMSLLAMGLLSGAGIGILGFLYNLLFVTLGNILGGIFLVALPYSVLTRAK